MSANIHSPWRTPFCPRSLARRNALDMLAVQPQGPFLIGGHSYGGAVAMEIALLLEEWGHDVGLLLIMDTPRPEQVRLRRQSCEFIMGLDLSVTWP